MVTGSIAFGPNSGYLFNSTHSPSTVMILQMDYNKLHKYQMNSTAWDDEKVPDWATDTKHSMNKVICSRSDYIFNFLQWQWQTSHKFRSNRNLFAIGSWDCGLNDNKQFESVVGLHTSKNNMWNCIVNCKKDVLVVENGVLKERGLTFFHQWQNGLSIFSNYIAELFPNFNSNYTTFNHDLFADMCWSSSIPIDLINNYILNDTIGEKQFYNVEKSQNPIVRYVSGHFEYFKIQQVSNNI